jgi:hypothetical protein
MIKKIVKAFSSNRILKKFFVYKTPFKNSHKTNNSNLSKNLIFKMKFIFNIIIFTAFILYAVAQMAPKQKESFSSWKQKHAKSYDSTQEAKR